jgi:hypothetical protein
MPAPLQSRLRELAHSFAAQVLGAIRSASLEELASANGSGFVGNGRSAHAARATAAVAAIPTPNAAKPARSNGRLQRRSAEEIAKTLDKIVLLVKTQKNGLRAEEIRSKLGMQAKEMPRILKEGLSTKRLTSKGQKRATTYFAK